MSELSDSIYIGNLTEGNYFEVEKIFEFSGSLVIQYQVYIYLMFLRSKSYFEGFSTAVT